MVMVKPFKALRPNKDYVEKVAALPYDTMNTEEAKKIAKENKYTYLRIDRAEINFDNDIDIYSEKVYQKAKEVLDDFIERNILIEDKKPSLYVYREVMGDRSQIGIVGCVSVLDGINGKIKTHENTKPDKVEDRTKHIDYCQAHTGTILLTYDNNSVIDIVIAKTLNNESIYDFISEDGIRHTIWKLDEKEEEMVVNSFERVENLYIADGHHRSAAAQNYAIEKKDKNLNYSEEEEFNFYPAMIAAKNTLHVMDYNRVVKDLNGLDIDEFLNKIEENFILEKVSDEFKPKEKFEYGMYIDEQWYKLVFNKRFKLKDDSVENLDVSVLHDYLIEPILGISEPQKDKRIDFIGGIRGTAEIEKRVNEDMKVGFSLYPTSIDELLKVADEDRIMPAKSTWFEPKVRCGLFLHRI